MLNPFNEVNWHPDLAEKRKFAKSLIIGFPCVSMLLLLSGWLATKTLNFNLIIYIGGFGFLIGLFLLVFPGCARPFYVVWYSLACCIGIVVGNLLLGVVFYVFILGTGSLLRTLGRGSISKSFDKQAPTYWRDAKQPSDPRRYFRQF